MKTIIAILRAAHCKSTHHYFAIDALDEVTSERGKMLGGLLLANYGDYLKGAKDPDNVFKDFENHVLHVRDGYWGGAAKTAEKWLDRCLKFLSANDWKEAAYAIGVLSHYFSDPFMPLHTAQSPRETIVHRPLEWSVCCSYEAIFKMACDNSEFESFSLAQGSDWLSDGILRGATMANQFYDLLMDDYDMKESSKHPELALGFESKQSLARIFTWVLTGWGNVIDRIANESNATIPNGSLLLPTLLAGVQIPAKKIVAAIESAEQRKEVEKIIDEFQHTGNVVRNVSPEQRVVQKVRKERPELRPSTEMVQRAVSSDLMLKPKKLQPATRPRPLPSKTISTSFHQLNTTLPKTKAAHTQTETPNAATTQATPLMEAALRDTPPKRSTPDTSYKTESNDGPNNVISKPTKRPSLTINCPIVDAPAIGPKTAVRMNNIGLNTIRDLMTQDAESIAAELNTKWITPKIVSQWQDQARLACQIERLSAAGSGLLVLAGIRTARDLSELNSADAFAMLQAAAQSSEGKRLLRDQGPPPLSTVQRWIDAAKSSGRAA